MEIVRHSSFSAPADLTNTFSCIFCIDCVIQSVRLCNHLGLFTRASSLCLLLLCGLQHVRGAHLAHLAGLSLVARAGV
jgi:hypothetical protein